MLTIVKIRDIDPLNINRLYNTFLVNKGDIFSSVRGALQHGVLCSFSQTIHNAARPAIILSQRRITPYRLLHRGFERMFSALKNKAVPIYS